MMFEIEMFLIVLLIDDEVDSIWKNQEDAITYAKEKVKKYQIWDYKKVPLIINSLREK